MLSALPASSHRAPSGASMHARENVPYDDATDHPVYWVEPDKLLAGEYPRNKDAQSSQAKISALLRAGVTAFIDLTEVHEGLHPYTAWIGAASHQRFPIRDGSIPASLEVTRTILNAMDPACATLVCNCLDVGHDFADPEVAARHPTGLDLGT